MNEYVDYTANGGRCNSDQESSREGVRSGQILDILKVDQLDLQIDVNVWNVEERGENEAKV